MLTATKPAPVAATETSATLALGITITKAGKSSTTAYGVQQVGPQGHEERAFRLSHDGSVYRVSQNRNRHNGHWHACTCKAAEHNPSKVCKHVFGLVQVGLFESDEALNRLRRLNWLDGIDG